MLSFLFHAQSGHWRALVLLALAALCTAAELRAQVLIPEASKRVGDRQTGAVFQLFYGGVCGDRISASIAHTSRNSLQQNANLIAQYARDSVPALLGRCPEAKVVETTVRHSAQSPESTLRFEMARSDNWTPSPAVHSEALEQALVAAGYTPMRGPAPLISLAWVRYRDGAIDGLYGTSLENRFVATDIRAVPEPAVGQFNVRGQWFETSSMGSTTSCKEPQSGYGRWGSFTTRVVAAAGNLTLLRSRCEADKPSTNGPDSRLQFSNVSRRDSERLNIGNRRVAAVLAESLGSSNTVTHNESSDEFRARRQPLFENANLRIYASEPDLCTHLRFDAVYRVNSAARDAVFRGNYLGMISARIRTLAESECGAVRGAAVQNQSLSDAKPWDQLQLRFRTQNRNTGTLEPVATRITTHRKFDAARAHDEWLARNRLGPECTDGPFCELPGGRYLNAIYRGDLTAVRQMDYLFKESARMMLEGQAGSNPLAQQLLGVILNDQSGHLLRDAANKYLHTYAAWPERCFGPGAQTYTFEYTEPVVVETDEFGITTTSGGQRYTATYRLNPEFFSLRGRIGSHKQPKRSDAPYLPQEKALVYRGLVDLKNTYACDGREIAQFEANLRRLTNAVLEQPGTREPPADARPPAPEQRITAAFPALPNKRVVNAASAEQNKGNTRPQLSPPPLPVPAQTVALKTTRSTLTAPMANRKTTARTTAPRPAPATTAAQNPGDLMVEMQRINERHALSLNALNEELSQALAEVSTAAEQQAVLASFRPRMQALQQQLQQEMSALQQRYRR
ncbi:MAG: hypothetical protein AAF648_01340 [Pseudomonadota bacterium]